MEEWSDGVVEWWLVVGGWWGEAPKRARPDREGIRVPKL